MKRMIFLSTVLFTAAALLLSGCSLLPQQETRLSIVCTTYPVYVLASTVSQGVSGVVVERLDTGSGGCLHDYTLSVNDMKKLEGADIIALSGAGLEGFMQDALAASPAAVIDCSEGLELLESRSHDHLEGDEDHDHGHWDPHYWMDLNNLQSVAGNLGAALARLDPEHEKTYLSNAQQAQSQISWQQLRLPYLLRLDAPPEERPDISCLVTFHDGFSYFADALHISRLVAIEEEAGSEASAREIAEITGLVQELSLPVIFTEVNGSDATARAIARETGCRVFQLSLLLDGPETGDLLSQFLESYALNVSTLAAGFAGEEEPGAPS